MKSEFIRFYTSDNIELQGLFFKPGANNNSKAVVHIHGLSGNFYENHFIDSLAKDLTRFGYSFLVFNNRGHDYSSDLVKTIGKDISYIDGGSAYEIFSECIQDIDAAIEYLSYAGIKAICLQGHSTGANKAIYYQYRKKAKKVKAIVLLSPCDDLGILQSKLGKNKFMKAKHKASELIRANKERTLMPAWAVFCPMSAKTYLDSYRDKSPLDIFPYRNRRRSFKELSSIQTPLLILFGNNCEYVQGSISETLELIKSKAKSSSRVDTRIIDGAPHNYVGKEVEISTTILEWLRANF